MKKIATLFVVAFSSCANAVWAQCPTSSFFVPNTNTWCPPLIDTFFNTSTNTDSGSTYLYDFGDGASSMMEMPVHIYPSSGIFYPSLIVTNTGGCADTFFFSSPISVGSCWGVGVNNSSINIIQISPTPFTNTINTSVSAADGSADVQVWNLMGQIVFEENEFNISSATKRTLDLSFLNSGVYVVRVVTAEGVFTQKVVKE
ncbi:MAG TPA: hypothetical protein DCQ93_10120 [Bacteroidetes bacterium]|nr:hypothetical protein [Bacteroidota bacterium]